MTLYTRKQACFVLAVLLLAGWLLYSAVTKPQPIPLSGTAIGPCSAFPLGALAASADVYATSGQWLTSGLVGRWRRFSGEDCMTSVAVADIGAEAEWYELRIGGLVTNVDGRRLSSGQVFHMTERMAECQQRFCG